MSRMHGHPERFLNDIQKGLAVIDDNDMGVLIHKEVFLVNVCNSGKYSYHIKLNVLMPAEKCHHSRVLTSRNIFLLSQDFGYLVGCV